MKKPSMRGTASVLLLVVFCSLSPCPVTPTGDRQETGDSLELSAEEVHKHPTPEHSPETPIPVQAAQVDKTLPAKYTELQVTHAQILSFFPSCVDLLP